MFIFDLFRSTEEIQRRRKLKLLKEEETLIIKIDQLEAEIPIHEAAGRLLILSNHEKIDKLKSKLAAAKMRLKHIKKEN